MKYILLFIGLHLLFNLSAQNAEGTWYGNLDLMGQQLSLVMHIEENENGFSITLDSPDQNAFGIETDSSSVTNRTVYFQATNIGAKFEGRYLPDLDSITGTFHQGGSKFPLHLSRSEIKKREQFRPQEPQPPFDYKIEEITFKNKKAKVEFAGTLTQPNSPGPHPIVIMITGSGPQDRNEEILGHKPFWVIADHLAKNGIACLRYDDRGFGKSTGNFQSATTFDFAEDVQSAVSFLSKKDDFSTIGLIGHSEGGLIAPMVASKNKNVDFIVLLAGTGVNGKEIVKHQQKLIIASTGETEENVALHVYIMEKIIDHLLNEKTIQKTIDKNNQFLDSLYQNLEPQQKEYIGNLSQFKMSLNMSIATDWFKTFMTIEPEEYLRKLKIPVLALFGSKDLQVDPEQNLLPMKKALKYSKSTFEIKNFENKNHLFQNTTTGKIDEYGAIEETISEDVLEYFTEWILKNTK